MTALLTAIPIILLFAFQVYTDPANSKPEPVVEQTIITDPLWITQECESYTSRVCGVGSAQDTEDDQKTALDMAKEDIRKKQPKVSNILILENWITSKGKYYILVVE